MIQSPRHVWIRPQPTAQLPQTTSKNADQPFCAPATSYIPARHFRQDVSPIKNASNRTGLQRIDVKIFHDGRQRL